MPEVIDHTLPAVHAAHLVELVGRWGVTPEQFLGPIDLEQERLGDPRERLSLATIERLIDRARQLTGEPGLGFYLGLAMRISWHGYLGFAAMTAGTLREAIQLAIRFMPTRTTALSLRLHEESETASLILTEHAALGGARDVLVTALLVGLSELALALSGREPKGQAEFAFAEPDYFPRFAHVLRGKARFEGGEQASAV